MSEQTYQLVVSKGPKPGQVFPLLADQIMIGRDPMADISIADPEISRKHARLEKTPEGYQIKDLGSTNGTYIDGQRLEEDSAQLKPGQSVVFGSGVVLKYQSAGTPDLMATMIDASALPLPEEPLDKEPTELPAAESAAPTFPPPQAAAPPPPPPAQAAAPPPPPLVDSMDEGDGKKSKRTRNIVLLIVLLILCCCCAFIVSGYYWWGDLLLQQLQSAGLY